MLDQIINDSARVERLRSGPLGPYLQCFAASLANLGYATLTVRAQIGFLDGSTSRQRVLGACGQSTPAGRRGNAIIVLLARHGLRASEILTLNLGDINWRARGITIPGKGRVRENLPLPVDAGRALANYLRRDRPPCGSRRVFLRTKAPHRGLAHASTVPRLVGVLWNAPA